MQRKCTNISLAHSFSICPNLRRRQSGVIFVAGEANHHYGTVPLHPHHDCCFPCLARRSILALIAFVSMIFVKWDENW